MTATALAIFSGIFWTISYLLIVQRSIQERSVGMPLVALCINISWEFIFPFVFPTEKPQLYINYVWFFLNLVIVIAYLNFGKAEFSKQFPESFFYAAFFSTLDVSFLNMLFITYEFGTEQSAIYTAFQDNLIVSIVFICFYLMVMETICVYCDRQNDWYCMCFYFNLSICAIINTLNFSLSKYLFI